MFYQLKAIRKKTKPPIWRRIVVPSNITFAQLAVILEAMLEYGHSEEFEFEFYQSKVRVYEWCEEKEDVSDSYYSYLNAADTYINQWMEHEKAFTFRRTGEENTLPEYRLEIEKIIDYIEFEEEGTPKKANSPIITKQVSTKDDTYWSDPFLINARMRMNYYVNVGQAEYQKVSEVLAQINLGYGLTSSESMVDRDIHTKKSFHRNMEELGEQIRQTMAEIEECKRQMQELQRKCNFEEFLNTYYKEELLELAEDLGITLKAKRKDRMVHEIAKHLLQENVMSARLLRLDEKQLDTFEKVYKEGPFFFTDKEWERYKPSYHLAYLCAFSDDSVQVPDEVKKVYQALLEKGYREYHRKVAWILRCIEAANCLYMATPIKVLYQMFLTDATMNMEYQEFCQLLDTIPESETKCIVKNQKLIYVDIYATGAYKKLEEARRGSYYILGKEEIEIFAKDQYPSYEPTYQSLLQFFLKKLKHQKDFSEYLSRLAFCTFAGGGFISDYMNHLNNMEVIFDSNKQAQQFANLLVKTYNDTRMAELSGHKPTEMSNLNTTSAYEEKDSQVLKTEKKVYPNDPCPCGSGRKYKKCCGK